jgi:uncharacterized protein YciI
VLYLILADDAPDAAPRRAAARPAHLAYLQALQDQGRLILAGPRPKADTEDLSHGVLDDARAWAAADPYAQAGVFAHTRIEPVLPVFPR